MNPTKRDRIIYWIATVWLSLGMVSTGIVQVMALEEETKAMRELGYPMYFLTLIGIWKFMGVIAILIPRFPLVKEWAYAGFFFTMTGAIYSHIAMSDPFSEMAGAILLVALTFVSWKFRPADRKITELQ